MFKLLNTSAGSSLRLQTDKNFKILLSKIVNFHVSLELADKKHDWWLELSLQLLLHALVSFVIAMRQEIFDYQSMMKIERQLAYKYDFERWIF